MEAEPDPVCRELDPDDSTFLCSVLKWADPALDPEAPDPADPDIPADSMLKCPDEPRAEDPLEADSVAPMFRCPTPIDAWFEAASEDPVVPADWTFR